MKITYIGNQTWVVRDANGRTVAVCHSLLLAQSFTMSRDSLSAATLSAGAL